MPIDAKVLELFRQQIVDLVIVLGDLPLNPELLVDSTMRYYPERHKAKRRTAKSFTSE